MYDNLILSIHTMSIWFWSQKPGVTAWMRITLSSTRQCKKVIKGAIKHAHLVSTTLNYTEVLYHSL
jgi:hypothetical protein